jgi:hypothetical protein
MSIQQKSLILLRIRLDNDLVLARMSASGQPNPGKARIDEPIPSFQADQYNETFDISNSS